LKKHKGLKCSLALNGKAFQRGKLYIARPDYHLLIGGNKVLEIGGFRSPQEGQTVEFDVVKGAQRLPGRKRPTRLTENTKQPARSEKSLPGNCFEKGSFP